MAVGFSGDVTFRVVPGSDARLPMPVPATDSDARTYDASILLDDIDEYDALESYISGFDILPAMGGGGLVTVTRGRGARTLTIPLSDGAERAYHAILVSTSPHVRMLDDSHFAADVSFLILGLDE